MANNQYYTRSLNSLSGADMRASFAGKEIGTLQGISYAIQREKAPIFVLGEVNARAFSRGKRGIAGSMVFVMFDEHSLLGELLSHEDGKYANFVKDKNEFDPIVFRGGGDAGSIGTGGVDVNLDPTGADNLTDWGVHKAFYMDQIPPFDITVLGVNELGAAARLQIWGAECLNEGYGISIDDMMSEMQCTYVCRHISRWTKIDKNNGNMFTYNRVGNGVVVGGPNSQAAVSVPSVPG
jgi:hypothetical protein